MTFGQRAPISQEAAFAETLKGLADRIGAAERAIANPTSPETLALNDDTAAFIDFTSTEVRGIMLFAGNSLTGGSGVVAFRTGSSPFMQVLSTAGATINVDAAAANLGGTTGADGAVNIRSRTNFNRIFVENRLGSARSWGVSFLALTSGTTDGSWTPV